MKSSIKMATLFWLIVLIGYSESFNNDPVKLPSDLETNSKVINLSSSQKAAVIIKAGLKVLEIDSVQVTIVDMVYDPEFDIEYSSFYEAHITNPYANAYTIFLSTRRSDLDWKLDVISHELIHLDQYHRGDLFFAGEGLIVFEGDTVKADTVLYSERRWEIEAFSKQKILSRQIREIIIEN